LELGRPFDPMLAHRYKTGQLKQGLQAMDGEPFMVEVKRDGYRTLVHKKGKDVQWWTRRMTDYTSSAATNDNQSLTHSHA
jgi:ATP-dependent DNA ligase